MDKPKILDVEELRPYASASGGGAGCSSLVLGRRSRATELFGAAEFMVVLGAVVLLVVRQAYTV